MTERACGIELNNVEVGHTVWYGSLSRGKMTELLTGKVGFHKKGAETIDVIVTREGRMGKVNLRAGHKVLDLGIQQETSLEYRVAVPGVVKNIGLVSRFLLR